MAKLARRSPVPPVAIAARKARKELVHNEALSRVDLLLHPAVEAGPNDSPPGAPEAGQIWLVGDDPEADWEGRQGCLAMWTDVGWRFVEPQEGTSVWRKASGYPLRWDDGAWTSALAVASIEIGGLQVLGAQQPAIPSPSGGTVIDAEARAALAAVIAALMSHGLIE